MRIGVLNPCFPHQTDQRDFGHPRTPRIYNTCNVQACNYQVDSKMLKGRCEDQEMLCRHELEHRHSTLAVCIIEPVLQGANGMRMIDPLYQRVLVEACRYVHHTCHSPAFAHWRQPV